MLITKFENTCEACPSQWHFETENNLFGYVRYRWGKLRVHLSEKDDGIYNEGNLILSIDFSRIDPEKQMDGFLEETLVIGLLESLGFEFND